MKKRITVFLDENEQKIIETFSKRTGGNPPQILKECLKFKFDKQYPVYVVEKNKEPQKQYTKEQICESYGGRVGKLNNLDDICIVTKTIKDAWGQESSTTTNIPLNLMGTGEYKIKE